MRLDASDIADLRPLLAEVVRSTLTEIEVSESRLPAGRIGLTEAEAADALGVASHTLRDCRLRGEVSAKKVGARYVYSRSSLIRWLEGSK